MELLTLKICFAMHLRSSRYMCPFHHSIGDGTINQKFRRSRTVKALRLLKDLKGKVVSEEPFDIPVTEEIPLDEQLHPVSETADMYKLDNLDKLNVQLTPASSSYLPLSLDSMSGLIERADNLDFNSLEVNNDTSTVINFENNES